jgi:plastocyanin
MRRFHRTVAACGVALMTAACGGQDALADEMTDTLPELESPAATEPAPAPAAAPATSTLTATLTEWDVTLSQQSVPAGTVIIDVVNEGTVPHVLEVEGAGEEWETDPIEPGGRVSMSLELAAGEYRLYCPIDSAGTNHEAQGMVTQLRVQ